RARRPTPEHDSLRGDAVTGPAGRGRGHPHARAPSPGWPRGTTCRGHARIELHAPVSGAERRLGPPALRASFATNRPHEFLEGGPLASGAPGPVSVHRGHTPPSPAFLCLPPGRVRAHERPT